MSQTGNVQRLWQKIDRGYINLILRLVAGGIFIFSGVTKVIGYGQFIDAMGSYAALPQPVLLVAYYFLPWLELLVGAYLLLGLFLRWTAIVTAVLSLCFIAVNIIAIIYGSADCPSCFGPTIRLLSSQALAIDVFLLLTAIYLYLSRLPLFSLDGLMSRRRTEAVT